MIFTGEIKLRLSYIDVAVSSLGSSFKAFYSYRFQYNHSASLTAFRRINLPLIFSAQCFLAAFPPLCNASTYVPIMSGDILFFIPIGTESEASKATVLGIDNDANGERDDVQQLINSTYADSEYVRVRMHAIAANFQGIMSGSLSYAETKNKLIEIENSKSCIQRNTGIVADQFLLKNILSTHQRGKAFYSNAAAAIRSTGSLLPPLCQ